MPLKHEDPSTPEEQSLLGREVSETENKNRINFLVTENGTHMKGKRRKTRSCEVPYALPLAR